ncbi:helix-turn-helix domain-containing protein [Cohnella nanjingensis]|uniref:Helix-turn-helix domain-containing protein n=1 Tax=Cohnella nanjingensis TaxID=1387779 RepID=A0A7X0RNS2_9BACL|nr:helix-turn-helix domain-containing protein [Cohnella nanjingensis]MBB6669469.1 helix-turn-helix domain-containing protein [Cohnella nanjingensis]
MEGSQKIDYRLMSPYVRYVHEVEIAAGARTPDRHIYDYEFIFVVSGEGRLRLGERVHEMKGGDLFYIRPHLSNAMEVSGARPMDCFAVHFDFMYLGEGHEFSPYAVYLGQGLDEGVGRLRERPSVEPSEMDIPEAIAVSDVKGFYEAFKQLNSYFRRDGIGARLQLKSAMLRLLSLVYEELMTREGVRIGHPQADTVLEAIQYMEAHYAERIDAALLAARARFTPKYFGTLFKQATGTTISSYLLRLRIERAKQLLAQRKLSVEEIGARVGIGDIYYFSKLFKKSEGMSPSRYAASVAWPSV